MLYPAWWRNSLNRDLCDFNSNIGEIPKIVQIPVLTIINQTSLYPCR